MTSVLTYDCIVVGAGIVGISCAYHLAKRGKSVAIIDPKEPMSFTSAQSGENYRNWWPHPTMTAFTDRSIDLIDDLWRESGEGFHINRTGYLLATRADDISDMIAGLHKGYGASAANLIRDNDAAYTPTIGYDPMVDGVDVISDKAMIRQQYPQFDPSVSSLIHIRRAGDVGSHSMAMYMLGAIRASGGKLIKATCDAVERQNPYVVVLSTGETLTADVFVNAAGPFAGDVAQMFGIDLPLKNLLQQKIAFEDKAGAIPRHMPFTIDMDPITLDWGEDAALLAEDPDLTWLTEEMQGVIHVRPEGGLNGTWLKMGWAFNQAPSKACYEPDLDPNYPDLVLRAATRLNPALRVYLENLPRNRSHYGGYYTMTEENWPLIGPMGPENAFMAVGLSGFGTMAAPAAGELIANYVMGDPLPDYATDFTTDRYNNDTLMAELLELSRGVI